LKFETERVLEDLGISSDTCKTFLTEVISRYSTSKAVQVVCSTVLRSMGYGCS